MFYKVMDEEAQTVEEVVALFTAYRKAGYKPMIEMYDIDGVFVQYLWGPIGL